MGPLLLCGLLLAGTLLVAPQAGDPAEHTPVTGPWRAELESPGGPLPFGLELRRLRGEGQLAPEVWQAELVNGPERIQVPLVAWVDGELRLELDQFDSRIVARPMRSDRVLEGIWTRRGMNDEEVRLPFRARAGEAPRFQADDRFFGAPGTSVAGRWLVRFSDSKEPAVGIFEQDEQGIVLGTFLTTTGDYRWLAGSLEGGRLRLSCFDGAHAFLFDALLMQDGTLRGDFWSRDAWHETWNATPDPTAELPDPFATTSWNKGVRVDSLAFTDAETLGRRSLGDPDLRGRPRIVQVFGSWCPNCLDEARYLVELHERYAERGLAIVGVAFELTGNSRKDVLQLARWRARVGVPYPILYGGVADKPKATMTFGGLDEIRAFPTTVFIDREGEVVAVHSGFSGPAAGAAHERLRSSFEELVERMLTAGTEQRGAESDGGTGLEPGSRKDGERR